MNIGIIGIGFMGMTHFRAYQQVRGARVKAISTRDPKKLAGDWRSIQGNFGEPGTIVDLKGIAAYADWRQLLADPAIDLVDICLPPENHAEVSIAALKAGKHVLCEKPIAVDLSEARRMVAAAKAANRQLMIGQVLPFFPEYAWALKAVRSGKYGKFLGGYFKRIISEPTWLKDFFDPRRVGGPVVDLHIHDAHFIRLLAGMPKEVVASGRLRGDVVEFFTSQMRFDDPNVQVAATSGVIAQQGRPFVHGFEIYLEQATLVFDLGGLPNQPVPATPLTVLTARGKVECPSLKSVDGFVLELTDAVRSAKSNQPSELLAGSLALDALALCHKQTQAVVSGKTVKV